MKNKFRIITVVLSCLLLIGATVGICVSAEGTDPTVSIYKKNLNYDAAVEIVYAVDAQNLGDNTVKIAFSYDSITAPTVGEALDETAYEYVKSQNGTKDLDGATYYQVFSNGFAPVHMSKPIYAIPVIVDADNKVLAAGEADRFSIVDYCLARFDDENLSEDQQSLYKALTAYGASAQEALLGKGYTQEELDKYGYADAYYVAKITNGASGEVTYTRYREADVTLEAPKTSDGKIFAGFTDAAGNVLAMYGAENTASSWNYYDTTLEIGENAFVYNYGASGTVQTWTDADGNDLTLTHQHTAPYATGTTLAVNEVIEGRKSLYVSNGKLVLAAPEFTSRTDSHWRPIEIVNQNEITGAVGKTYVFETDLQIDFAPENQLSQTVLGDFGMTSSTDYGGNDKFFLFLTFNRTSTTQFKIQSMDSSKGDWSNLITGLNFGEKYNLRIEYKINSIGTCGSSTESTARGTVNIYINGELKTTYEATGYSGNTSASNSKFGGIGLLSWDYKATGAHIWYFDNTYLATED